MATAGTKRAREDDQNPEVSRPRKRPGGAARISRAEADVVAQRQQQRAEEARQAAQVRGVEEVVRQHYNAVPQRGREWRKTDSRIKGLRSFNNWVKSTIIHKFSPNDSDQYPLRVLDIGCGKGGDLGKWQQAPQTVELYVGVDPAEVSIDQARDRYMQMRSGGHRGGRGGRGGHHGGRQQRTFDAEFFAEDAFTYSLGDIPLIREVGFGPGSRWGPSGGFDVVTMMFCMHYAFENETKAKGMLANVAGSLKKGGRFFGAIPNSDVIRSGVVAFNERQMKIQDSRQEPAKSLRAVETGVVATGPDSDSTSKKREAVESADDKPPAKRVEEKDSPCVENTAALNVVTETTNEQAAREVNGESSHSPPHGSPQIRDAQKEIREKSAQSHQAESNIQEKLPSEDPVAEWGNSIYRVRFPGPTPKDGIFRPPYGWKYSFFMEEAVEEVPEYVVPWEAFRGYVYSNYLAVVTAATISVLTTLRANSIAEDYNLELQYRKPFAEVWREEKNHPVFGPLSERMGVRGGDAGPLLVSDEEMEAASRFLLSAL